MVLSGVKGENWDNCNSINNNKIKNKIKFLKVTMGSFWVVLMGVLRIRNTKEQKEEEDC